MLCCAQQSKQHEDIQFALPDPLSCSPTVQRLGRVSRQKGQTLYETVAGQVSCHSAFWIFWFVSGCKWQLYFCVHFQAEEKQLQEELELKNKALLHTLHKAQSVFLHFTPWRNWRRVLALCPDRKAWCTWWAETHHERQSAGEGRGEENDALVTGREELVLVIALCY